MTEGNEGVQHNLVPSEVVTGIHSRGERARAAGNLLRRYSDKILSDPSYIGAVARSTGRSVRTITDLHIGTIAFDIPGGSRREVTFSNIPGEIELLKVKTYDPVKYYQQLFYTLDTISQAVLHTDNEQLIDGHISHVVISHEGVRVKSQSWEAVGSIQEAIDNY
jgi:hypothetical protein